MAPDGRDMLFRRAGRLLVTPLRGYSAAADRVARRLSRIDGLAPATTTAYDDALALADRSPGDYDDVATVPARPEMPAAAAIATVLQGLVLKGAFLLLTILSFALCAWFLVLSPEERKLALRFP